MAESKEQVKALHKLWDEMASEMREVEIFVMKGKWHYTIAGEKEGDPAITYGPFKMLQDAIDDAEDQAPIKWYRGTRPLVRS